MVPTLDQYELGKTNYALMFAPTSHLVKSACFDFTINSKKVKRKLYGYKVESLQHAADADEVAVKDDTPDVKLYYLNGESLIAYLRHPCAPQNAESRFREVLRQARMSFVGSNPVTELAHAGIDILCGMARAVDSALRSANGRILLRGVLFHRILHSEVHRVARLIYPQRVADALTGLIIMVAATGIGSKKYALCTDCKKVTTEVDDHNGELCGRCAQKAGRAAWRFRNHIALCLDCGYVLAARIITSLSHLGDTDGVHQPSSLAHGVGRRTLPVPAYPRFGRRLGVDLPFFFLADMRLFHTLIAGLLRPMSRITMAGYAIGAPSATKWAATMP